MPDTTTTPTIASLFAQLHALPNLLRGTLSPMTRPNGRVYHNLQCWRDGRNHTAYVSADRLPQVQQAVANYQRFQQLTTQLAAALDAQTRTAWATAADRKNNSRRRSSPPPPRN